jgi:ATP-binding cassette subfamily C protein LapB
LVITHRTPFLRLVKRVIIVDRGRIVADGPRDQIMQKLNRPKVAAL